jgi:sugar/nucleoside kinase (ribokinase family)
VSTGFVVAVGEIMLDIGVPRLAAGTRHGSIRVAAGGSPVTAAIWAAAGGATATVVGRVGADPAAAAVRAELDRSGVRHRLAIDEERPTGAFLETAIDGEIAIVADRGANASLRAADVAALGADALLVSGYVLLHDDTAAAGAAALAQGARWRALDAASATLVQNLGRAPTLELAATANVLFVNADEARALTDCGPESALEELAARFELVCVKLGDGGALAARDREIRRARPPRRVPAAQAGAGDAFAGALLAGLLQELPLGSALEDACAAGAAAAAGERPTRP